MKIIVTQKTNGKIFIPEEKNSLIFPPKKIIILRRKKSEETERKFCSTSTQTALALLPKSQRSILKKKSKNSVGIQCDFFADFSPEENFQFAPNFFPPQPIFAENICQTYLPDTEDAAVMANTFMLGLAADQWTNTSFQQPGPVDEYPTSSAAFDFSNIETQTSWMDFDELLADVGIQASVLGSPQHIQTQTSFIDFAANSGTQTH